MRGSSGSHCWRRGWFQIYGTIEWFDAIQIVRRLTCLLGAQKDGIVRCEAFVVKPIAWLAFLGLCFGGVRLGWTKRTLRGPRCVAVRAGRTFHALGSRVSVGECSRRTRITHRIVVGTVVSWTDRFASEYVLLPGEGGFMVAGPIASLAIIKYGCHLRLLLYCKITFWKKSVLCVSLGLCFLTKTYQKTTL